MKGKINYSHDIGNITFVTIALQIVAVVKLKFVLRTVSI